MMKRIISLAVFFGLSVSIIARNYTISGFICDKETKETLVGCNIYEMGSEKGNFSNSYGFYSLSLSNGKKIVRYSHIGYEPKVIEISLSKDTTINIYLEPLSQQLNEVVVSSTKSLKDLRLGTVEVPIVQIKNSPTLLGETDLMKSIQYIPGVQNTTEGKSDLLVRGGSSDQNLILLDGVPIYNANHVFGFLSVFNTEAMKKVTLYKSSFPARFGGKLSSVIDITTKDGNKEQLCGSVSIGLPAVKFNLEAPIIKGKTSISLSARRTYVDLLMGALNKWFMSESNSHANFFFHDLNAKIHHKINDNTYIYLSAYNGNDKLIQKTTGIKNKETAHNTSAENWDWGSTIIAGRLSKVLSPNLFFKTTLNYNMYHYQINTNDDYTIHDNSFNVQEARRSFDFFSGIRDYSLMGDFEYFPVSNHNIKFGMLFTSHDFNPEVTSLSIKADTIKTTDNAPRHVYSNELGLYAEDEWDISRKIRLNAGLRFSHYAVDNRSYKSIDPRISLRLLLTEKTSLQVGYTLMQQYVHLLSSNSIILQTDLWMPVTKKIRPMQSSQYSLGMFCELPGSVLLSMETYYKDMLNVIEYKDGIIYTGVSAGWENKVEAGMGRSYGVEFSAEKRDGRFTGIASYTWSKSERRFDEINFGEWFPAKYDRRHVINLLFSYKLNEKFDFTTGWTYHSGDRITVPMMTYIYPDVQDTEGRHIENLLQLDHRNNYQMTSYHRLDIGVNYTFAKKKNRYSQLNLSIYNVYNRMNPYKVIIESEMHKQSTGESAYSHKLKQVTLFPIIPSISYTYHF